MQSELHNYHTPPLPGASSAANTRMLLETEGALLGCIAGVTSAWVLWWRAVTRQSYTAPGEARLQDKGLILGEQAGC